MFKDRGNYTYIYYDLLHMGIYMYYIRILYIDKFLINALYNPNFNCLNFLYLIMDNFTIKFISIFYSIKILKYRILPNLYPNFYHNFYLNFYLNFYPNFFLKFRLFIIIDFINLSYFNLYFKLIYLNFD